MGPGRARIAWRAVYDSLARSVENAKEMFGTNSLSWVLLQEQIWSPAVYARDEAAAYVARYRVGGTQELPARFSNAQFQRASFRGLDESVRLQGDASSRWRELLDGPLPGDVRRRMESDVVWFADDRKSLSIACGGQRFRSRAGTRRKP